MQKPWQERAEGFMQPFQTKMSNEGNDENLEKKGEETPKTPENPEYPEATSGRLCDVRDQAKEALESAETLHHPARYQEAIYSLLDYLDEDIQDGFIGRGSIEVTIKADENTSEEEKKEKFCHEFSLQIVDKIAIAYPNMKKLQPQLLINYKRKASGHYDKFIQVRDDQISKPGTIVFMKREQIEVNRETDSHLQSYIEHIRSDLTKAEQQKGSPLSLREKWYLLIKHISTLCPVEISVNSENLARKGKYRWLLGEVVHQKKASCRHIQLLTQVLGYAIGLSLIMRRGQITKFQNDSATEPSSHAWNELIESSENEGQQEVLILDGARKWNEERKKYDLKYTRLGYRDIIKHQEYFMEADGDPLVTKYI